MFDKFQKDDLVAYIDYPKSIPLGIVKEVKEHRGKAVVLLYLLDALGDEEMFSLKCVPYHKLELVSRAEYTKRFEVEDEHFEKRKKKE